MSQELVNSVNKLTDETSALLQEYVKGNTVLQNSASDAASSAAAAKASETNSVNQANIATQKAAESKQYRDETAAIATGGTATVDPSPGKIPLANSEGKISSGWLTALAFARTKADMDAMRASVNRQCAASGMIHAGKHFNSSFVNEGLSAYESAWGNSPNRVWLGRSSSANGAVGTSLTDEAVFNIAGFPIRLLGVGEGYNGTSRLFSLPFPQAPDGTDIYDSSGNCRGSGKPTLNLLTEVDPKYGDVAPNLNEAVARAFEGLVKNGDFRLGDNGDWAPVVSNRGTYSINSGELTVADTTNKTTALGSMNVAPVGLSSTAGVTYTVEVYVSSLTSSGVDSHAFRLGGYQDPNQTFVELKLGLNTFTFTAGISITDAFLIYVGNNQSMTVSSVSVRPATEEVVTERVDLSGLEGYLEEITPAKPYIYPYGGINNQATSVDGIATTVDNVRPITYFANFDGDTTSRGRGWNLNDLTDAQLLTILQNPEHHVYVIDGRLVQFRFRPREIKGAGNGDWLNINPNNTNQNYPHFILTFSSPSDTRVNPQGENDSEPLSGDPFYCVTRSTQYRTKYDNGVFGLSSTGNVNAVAYNGECYFYVLATVLRLNKGAYHEWNPLGAQPWNKTDGWGEKYWMPGVVKPTTKADAFKKATTIAGVGTPFNTNLGGSLASDTALGRPDGRRYDAIYPDGQGGVIDRRLSAFPITMDDYFKAMAKAENGTMRGMQKLARSKPFVTTYQAAIKQSSGTLIYIDGAFEFLTNSTQKPDSMYQNLRCNGYIISQVGSNSNGNYIYIHNSEGDVSAEFPLGTSVILTTDETNLSVSGNFTQNDVIGPPADILQVDALKDGWMGRFIPLIDEVATLEMSRKAVGQFATASNPVRYTDNFGGSWSGATSGIDSVTNTRIFDTSNGTRVYIVNYLAAAKVTKPSSVLPVYGSKSGLGPVIATEHNTVINGALLGESLMGKVLTASGVNTGLYTIPLSLLRLDPATGKVAGYDQPKHAAIPLAAPNNNSPAIKILPHAVSENRQAMLGYIWNELKYGDPEFVSFDSSVSTSFLANKVYRCTAGKHAGRIFQCLSNSTVAIDAYYIDESGNLVTSTGGTVSALRLWSGNKWGDDGAMYVIDYTGTYNNINGESCLYGYAVSALPIGWVDNHARFGAQVLGVDL